MSLITYGGAMPNAPFSRTFFNVTLGDVLERDGQDQEKKLMLYLVDGSTLEVHQIEEMSEQYLTLRAFRGSNRVSLSVHLIPYNLIYRIEIGPQDPGDSNRLGFHWKPVRKASAKKRGKRS